MDPTETRLANLAYTLDAAATFTQVKPSKSQEVKALISKVTSKLHPKDIMEKIKTGLEHHGEKLGRGNLGKLIQLALVPMDEGLNVPTENRLEWQKNPIQYLKKRTAEYLVSPEYQEKRAKTREKLDNLEEIIIETRDHVKLNAVWAPSPSYLERSKEAPTVLIFHGNGCTLDSEMMTDLAQWYQEQGSNVLMVTMRGYPGSEGSFKLTGEQGMYYDCEAALKAVHDKGVDKARIHAHGYSLGGAMAMTLGHYFNVPVTLDHTFTSTEAMAAKMTKILPKSFLKGVVKTALAGDLKKNQPDEAIASTIEEAKPFKGDGLNTLQKLRDSEKDVCIIYGKKDTLMPTSFADELYEAKHPKPRRKDKAYQGNQAAYQRDKEAYKKEKAQRVYIQAGGHGRNMGVTMLSSNDYDVSSPKYLKHYGVSSVDEYDKLRKNEKKNREQFAQHLENNNLLGSSKTEIQTKAPPQQSPQTPLQASLIAELKARQSAR